MGERGDEELLICRMTLTFGRAALSRPYTNISLPQTTLAFHSKDQENLSTCLIGRQTWKGRQRRGKRCSTNPLSQHTYNKRRLFAISSPLNCATEIFPSPSHTAVQLLPLLCIRPHRAEALSDAFVWRLSVACIWRN